MHSLSLLFTAFTLTSIVSAQSSLCNQLHGYEPAELYCSVRHPVPASTVTSSTTKTITVTTRAPTSTTSIQKTTTTSPRATTTTKPLTNGVTRTITEVLETTVTNCAAVTLPPCPYSNGLSQFTRPSASSKPVATTASGRTGVGPREAMPEPAPAPYSGTSSAAQALAWFSVMKQGDSAVKSLCSCIQPKPSTITRHATATATVTMKG